MKFVFCIFTFKIISTMEVKKLVRLIKDDIAHLEGITNDFFLESLPSSDEVQLALVRANALLRELELLHKFVIQHESSTEMVIPVEKPNVKFQKHESLGILDKETEKDEQEKILNPNEKDLIPVVEEHDTNLFGVNDRQSEELPETQLDNTLAEEHLTIILEPTEPIDVEPINQIFIEEEVDVHYTEQSESAESGSGEAQNKSAESDQEANVEPEVPVTEESAIVETVVLTDIPVDKEEILAQGFGEIKKTLNETIGETLLTVNDALSPEKSESGYQTLPIKSIWDGIGINDRFLFIRELFSNNNAKFETTVAALDKLSTIHDAVNYLKMNFKWNKSEASQKFLTLVKRRFTK